MVSDFKIQSFESEAAREITRSFAEGECAGSAPMVGEAQEEGMQSEVDDEFEDFWSRFDRWRDREELR